VFFEVKNEEKLSPFIRNLYVNFSTVRESYCHSVDAGLF